MTNRRTGLRGSSRQAHQRGKRPPVANVVVLACVVGVIGAIALADRIGTPATPTMSPLPTPVALVAVPPGSTSPSTSVPDPTAQPPNATADATARQPSASPSPAATFAADPSGRPVANGTGATNVYAGAGAGMFSAAVAAFPPRVYVPDEENGTVVVIDPKTYKILSRSKVGASPEHVTPDWDLQRLYVEAAFGGRITVVSPITGRPVGHHLVRGPYNLYFTLDGRMAIVVIDSRRSGAEYGGQKQLRFYDRRTWRLIKALDVPHAGADHLDFSADGRFFLLSTEYTGWLVKVDVRTMRIVGSLHVGGKPIDVRLAPDGRVFYVANQATNGVTIVDAVRLRKLGFLRTGRGAHGLAISRDARRLYVTNRLAGSLSVIDFARRRVIRTWHIGGSPDMIAVSPDGRQLWISNRYGGTISVIDSGTGRVIRIIRVGGRPHGLAYFPEPGRVSLGHNGIYR